ncbi:hypothetical protein P692DRAFT_20882763 [Suillus brevipes Sb2]|nr:hypothetical protein P692DRAFT_20882763 [Suillus brevipes Sb2]
MCLSTDSFDYAAARCTTISQLSNALGSELLDAYIALTANQKVSASLHFPSFYILHLCSKVEYTPTIFGD